MVKGNWLENASSMRANPVELEDRELTYILNAAL